jgi:hypothetical protein
MKETRAAKKRRRRRRRGKVRFMETPIQLASHGSGPG